MRRPITDAPPPPIDDDDLGFETEPALGDEAAFASFGAPEIPTDPERLAAQR
ncbi:hypothetical protein [Bradyrhizobium genosp. P]|uniref:hypothetical protein n=1 Tax=Bradyrhizobium genosp. P TaxID=83641 RepID=UPI003CF7CD4D